ncbi:hypothetical protein [Deinococcus aerophilus]|uniref:hypothetical protein n=1 Tax=Deinococcus aerophilus TaxID=522488 RepID=UPI001663E26B|nr:hypothetical protein [Deinococcus aerophilus]
MKRSLLPLAAVLSALLLTPAAGAAPTPLKWGALTVTVTPRPAGNFEAQARAVVRNGARTVLTVTDWDIEATLQPIRPGGLPELVLSAFSGGAHCCFTQYVFTQDGGRVENLAVFDAADDPGRWTDLNGDGTREFVWGSNTLTYYDWSFAESPFPLTVLGWDGVRLADRTRAYAYVPGQEAARELKVVLDGLAEGQGTDALKPRLSGYYANMILAGRGAEAERVLAAQVFARAPGLRAWFTAHRTDLINATYAQPEGRVRAVNSSSYPVREPDQP